MTNKEKLENLYKPIVEMWSEANSDGTLDFFKFAKKYPDNIFVKNALENLRKEIAKDLGVQ